MRTTYTFDMSSKLPPRPANRGQVSNLAFGQISRAVQSIAGELSKTDLSSANEVFDDLELQLKPLNAPIVRVQVAVTKSLDRYTILRIKDALREASLSGEGSLAVPKLLFSEFVSPQYEEELKAIGVGFADTVGNVSLLVPESGIYLDIRRVSQNPFRDAGRPLKSLSGEPSALVVRGILDLGTPLKASELITSTGVSRASAYRTLDYLEAQGFITRSAPGVVETSEVSDLINAVGELFGFGRIGPTYQYIAPRGLQSTLEKLKSVRADYAITGSVAAANFAPVASSSQLFLYSQSPDELANELGLRPVDSGGDVFINIPEWGLVFQRRQIVDSLTLVSSAQIAIDLIDGPGRNPQEGEALIEWIVNRET
jgi:hypothetical protein